MAHLLPLMFASIFLQSGQINHTGYSTQTDHIDMRVDVSAALSVVPNAQVDVTQGQVTTSYATGPDGATQYAFHVFPGQAMKISVGEVDFTDSGGTLAHTLGQVFEQTESLTQGAQNVLLLSLEVPVAVPEILDSTNPFPVTSHYADLWGFSPPQNATTPYNFVAQLGFLPTHESVERYTEYQGLAVGRADYIAGFVVRSDDASLGSSGFALTVNFSHSSPSDPPFVDAYHIGPVPGPGFQSSLLAWKYQRAAYHIEGQFKTGVNLLLFYPAPAGQAQSTVQSQYLYGVVPQPRPLDDPPGVDVEDCSPTAPGRKWDDSPEPPAPDPSAYCSTPIKKGNLRIGERSVPLGQKTCGGMGGTIDTKHTYRGTTTIKFTFNGPVGGEFGAGEEHEYSVGQSSNYSLGSGAGCGQCTKAWSQERRAYQDWDVERVGFSFVSLWWECQDSCETTCDLDEYTSFSEPCDRQCN